MYKIYCTSCVPQTIFLVVLVYLKILIAASLTMLTAYMIITPNQADLIKLDLDLDTVITVLYHKTNRTKSEIVFSAFTSEGSGSLGGTSLHYGDLVNERFTNEKLGRTLVDNIVPMTNKREIEISNSILSHGETSPLKGKDRNYVSTEARLFDGQVADPICDRWYDASGSKHLDIVPRRAYYDNRTISGESRNLVIILTEMLDSPDVERSVLSCELNGYYSAVTVVKRSTWWGWVKTHRPGHTHYNTFMQCAGFPQEAIREGSTVKLIYRKSNESCYSRVATEKPLVLMKQSTLAKVSVVVCSALFGRPPYFNEWLRYQKTIGVDKVHLNVETSFSEHATQTYPYLKAALSNGFASMEVWNDYLGDKSYYYSQILKYQDCAMRFTGVYTHALICDPDDFFNPVIPGIKDIHYYIDTMFSKKKFSSLRLRWKRYVCKPVKSLYLPDGNVTQSLRDQTSFWTTNFKTIHRLDVTNIVSVHAAAEVFPHYKYRVGNSSLAYMAHIRPGSGCPK